MTYAISPFSNAYRIIWEFNLYFRKIDDKMVALLPCADLRFQASLKNVNITHG